MIYIATFISNLGIFSDIISYFCLSIFTLFIYQGVKTKGKIRLEALTIPFSILTMLWGLLFFPLYYITFESFIIYLAIPILTIMTGWAFLEYSDNTESMFKCLIFSVLVGCALHGLLNIFCNQGLNNREVLDFFRNDSRAATGAGAINTLAMSLLGVAIITKNKVHKILLFSTIFIATVYTFLIGTRTQLIIMILVSIIILYIYNKEMSYTQGGVKAILLILLLVFVIYMIFKFNIFGLQDRISSTNLYARLILNETSASDVGRIQKFIDGIKFMCTHLFGGDKQVPYFHNMWLDIARISGLIPCVVIIVANIIEFHHCLCVVKNKKYGIELRYMLLSIHLGLLLNFFVEPVMEGMVDLFFKYCLVAGMNEYLFYHHENRSLKI